MHLSALQMTPLPSERKEIELAARLGRLAVAYSVAAVAGALAVVLVAILLKVQENSSIDLLPLLRALMAFALIFACGFSLGRMKGNFLH